MLLRTKASSRGQSGSQDVQEFMERTSPWGVGVAISSAPGDRNALEHVWCSAWLTSKFGRGCYAEWTRQRSRLATDQRSPPPTLNRCLHQPELSRLGDGCRCGDCQAHSAGAQRINDRLMSSGGATLRPRGAGLRKARRCPVYVEGASKMVLPSRTRRVCAIFWPPWKRSSASSTCSPPTSTASQEAVRVVVGLQDAMPHLSNFVLIGKPARVGDEVMGSPAVIGLSPLPTSTPSPQHRAAVDKLWNEST